MSASLPPSERFSPDDALPPVEPPSAGFIVQLFVVPGAIVVVIIMVWLMFNWLAHMGNDRDAYVRALSRNNEARWQAAYNLAEALRSERIAQQPVLTVDKKLAEQLAGILAEEIEAGSMEERPISLRIYLSRAGRIPRRRRLAGADQGRVHAACRRRSGRAPRGDRRHRAIGRELF